MRAPTWYQRELERRFGNREAAGMRGSLLDSVANVMAIIVIVLVPVLGIAVFWIVHVLPEKIAEKRHHPQKDAIKVLCLLSLVFGGMLWPLAWLWAFSKPVFHQLAYGRDKHDDYYLEHEKKGEHEKQGAREQARTLERVDEP